MSSQQTRTPSDRSPAGAEPETHWSEDTDLTRDSLVGFR